MCVNIIGYLLVKNTREGPPILFLVCLFVCLFIVLLPPPQREHEFHKGILFYSLMYFRYLFIGAIIYWASTKCHEVKREKGQKKKLKRKQVGIEAVGNVSE